jgi:RNA recognition motif-containing protein
MNIYVSSLSFNNVDNDLRELFSGYGEVSSAKVIMDRETNRSKGFGFVEMPDDNAGRKAIAELNGTQFNGRAIGVTEARQREARTFTKSPFKNNY